MPTAKQTRKYRNGRRLRGLCLYCPNSSPNGPACDTCKLTHTKRMQKARQLARELKGADDEPSQIGDDAWSGGFAKNH